MKLRVLTMAAVIVAAVPCFAPSTSARELTFEERVKAQEAIERVYYAHQLGATKPFEEAVPRAVIETKVTTYLKESVALDTIWNTPVTAEMLNHELARISRDTRFPDRLMEIYAALGNDAFLVEECFARPAVVDRLARSFEGGGKAGTNWDAWWDAMAPNLDPRQAPAVAIPGPLPSRAAAGPTCPQLDAWNNGVLGKIPHPSAPRGVWTGSLFVIWGADGMSYSSPGFRYDPVIDDWTPMTTVGAPPWRLNRASLVWTGSEVIAWGGYRVGAGLNTGGRYNPISNSWKPVSTASAPSSRSEHTAIWTGSRMIIWGGTPDSTVCLNTGGVYDPSTDTWRPTSAAGAPLARKQHVAVWTGSRMIVFGGIRPATFPNPDEAFGSGGVYDPVSDTWTNTTFGPKAQRTTAVWTGREMVVWGGAPRSDGWLNSGARYDPVTNSWSATSMINAPSGRRDHNAVWTGSRMLVWGGNDAAGNLNTGGSYDPVSNSWAVITTNGAPSARSNAAAVWTGSRMIVWGGSANTGGRYDPTSDSWTPTTTYGTPDVQNLPPSAWSGTVAMFWRQGLPGGRYDPLIDAWSPMAGLPVSIRGPGVWTGQRLFAWGAGTGAGTPGRAFNYDPVSNSWAAASTIGAPDDRRDPSVVWTGDRVIVWGGTNPSGTPLGDGGRYDPSLDLWTPVALAGAPSPRTYTVAVWTGTRMIVWGGTDATYRATLQTGGRYDPVSDTWQPTSVAGAPDPRRSHSIVWTGAEVVVWGGATHPYGDFELLDTGGRYDPIGDSWSPTSLTGAPAGRLHQSTVWTGTRMLLFGGKRSFFNSLNDLALYDPSSDHWSTGGSALSPTARINHAAVWDGSGMIVWGGLDSNEDGTWPLASGGRYVPDDELDGDGVADDCDNCPVVANPDQIDGDADGLGDACDSCPTDAANDQDDDGVCGSVDNCIGVFNHAQRDSDGDGGGDLCDNCPTIANANQADADGDREGDVCDCRPFDATKRRPPDAKPLVANASGASTVLSWPAVPAANAYAVTRGNLDSKAPNQYGSCVANGLVSPNYVDPSLPAPGQGYFYLVQGVNVTCGAGSLGMTSTEEPRVNASPGACAVGP